MDYHFMSHRSKVGLGLIILCIAGAGLTCSDNKPNCAPEGQPAWEPGGEDLLLTVDRTWLHIAVVPNPDRDGFWQIITIEESIIPEAAGGRSKLGMLTTPPITWSYIKSIFK